MSSRSRWAHLIGTTELLRKCVQRPVTSPKSCRMRARFCISSLKGATKTAASSAYKDVRRMVPLHRNLCKWPSVDALSRTCASVSMVRTKNSGESWSRWHKPRPCRMGTPGTPLRSTLEVAVVRRTTIQYPKRLRNPLLCGRSMRWPNRLSQKALRMSSLKRSADILLLWHLVVEKDLGGLLARQPKFKPNLKYHGGSSYHWSHKFEVTCLYEKFFF
jgi:hypothetical protein